MTDDLQAIEDVLDTDYFCVMAPLSYAGRKRSAENARNLYAIVVDLDGIIVKDGFARGLEDLWGGHILAADRIPMPTYFVYSGNGVHLYYVFESPLPLFRNVVKQFQKYKKELTSLIWNEGITEFGSDEKLIQQEGIYQAFRMPGTITKNGKRAVAYKCGEKVTVNYMNQYVFKEYQVTEFAYKSELTLKEAKEKYPEWYHDKIELGMPRKKWAVNRNVYDWWKKEIFSKAKVGHRYYCLMMLSIYAEKCSKFDEKKNPNPVTRDELEADCFELMETFEQLTTDPENHFTEIDVQDALEAFEEAYITYPRNSVAYRAGIEIKANKRNYRKQKTHLEIARATKKVLKDEGDLKGEGRPSKEMEVTQYFIEHPDATTAQAMADLGVIRPTIAKYKPKRNKVSPAQQKADFVANLNAEEVIIESDTAEERIRQARMRYLSQMYGGKGTIYQMKPPTEEEQQKIREEAQARNEKLMKLFMDKRKKK